MADLIIRNGTIVDGTGAARRTGDVAITGERITGVGDLGDDIAPDEIDATGLLVTPGWVDIHTHYDGQATWDPDLAPSSINGVTSIVMGNCGVGFAPAQPEKHDWLIALLEGVEDIPGTALAEGLTWGWESFDDYLDVLDDMRWTVDVGTQVPHAALRTYVMGDRGADHESLATPDEIEHMCRLTESAIRNGALGFTTSRTWAHRTATGDSIGTLKATADEVVGVAHALNRAGTGVIQLISDVYQSGDDELVARELELLGRIVDEVGRPMSFTVQQNDETPDRWRELLGHIERWSERADVRAQVAVRPIGVLLGLAATANPLRRCPSYARLHHLPLDERVTALRDPDVRARILDEHRDVSVRDFPALLHRGFDRMYPLGERPNYEPSPEDSVAGIAAASGRRAAGRT